MPIVLKSGSLNLLEPSGPVQVCNGVALPLPFMCVIISGALFVDVWFYCIDHCELLVLTHSISRMIVSGEEIMKVTCC